MSPCPAFVLLFSAYIAVSSAEITLKDGSEQTYDELIVSIESPLTFLTLKSADGVKVIKYSEADVTKLDAATQEEIKAYIAEQLQKRMIIESDKWVHRNEMLLNRDPRYAAKGKLPRAGKSIITFTNTTDHAVTLGVRSGGRGYEMHLEAGKKKGYPVPDGDIWYFMAQESEDGAKLLVQKSPQVITLRNSGVDVTIVTAKDVPTGELGLIDIPPEYQVVGP